MPICEVREIPYCLKETSFETSIKLENVIQLFEMTLKKYLEDGVFFQLIPSRCTWECCFLNETLNCRFDIQVYCYSSRYENTNHIVEMRLVSGNQEIFQFIFSTFKRLLHDAQIKGSLAEQTECSSQLGSASAIDAGFTSELPNQTSAPLIEDADKAKLKNFLVATLQDGDPSAVVMSTQLACFLYTEIDFRLEKEPEEVDINCMKELMKIVNETKNEPNLACQHAMWALACMSCNYTYCEKIPETEELGIQFLSSVLELSFPRTFSTEGMRCRCVKLFLNLIRYIEPYLLKVLNMRESELDEWQYQIFVLKVINPDVYVDLPN